MPEKSGAPASVAQRDSSALALRRVRVIGGEVASIGLHSDGIEMPSHIRIVLGDRLDFAREPGEHRAQLAAARSIVGKGDKSVHLLTEIGGGFDVGLAVLDAV